MLPICLNKEIMGWRVLTYIPAKGLPMLWPDPHDINIQAVILLDQCLMVSENACHSFVDCATDTRDVLEIFNGQLSHNHLGDFVGHTGETLRIHARMVGLHVEYVVVMCSELTASVLRLVETRKRKHNHVSDEDSEQLCGAGRLRII